jgi:hypothetical protein
VSCNASSGQELNFATLFSETKWLFTCKTDLLITCKQIICFVFYGYPVLYIETRVVYYILKRYFNVGLQSGHAPTYIV